MARKQFSKIAYLIVFSIIVAFLLFSNNGLVKYFRLNNELDNIRLNIEKANLEIEKLDSQIDSLKNSTVKIERVAREKYRMKYDYEIPIKVKTN